jgi:hypothetical protein
MITRKFALVMCSTFFSRDAMLQASVAVSIMFFCYIIQTSKRPFIKRLPTSPTALHDVTQEIGAARAARLSYVFDYNTLENALLITSTATLLSGMVFSSASLAETYESASFVSLSVLLFITIITAVGGFMIMLLREIYRSFQFALITASIAERQSRRITVTKNTSYKGVANVNASEFVPEEKRAPGSVDVVRQWAAVTVAAVEATAAQRAGEWHAKVIGMRAALAGRARDAGHRASMAVRRGPRGGGGGVGGGGGGALADAMGGVHVHVNPLFRTPHTPPPAAAGPLVAPPLPRGLPPGLRKPEGPSPRALAQRRPTLMQRMTSFAFAKGGGAPK